MLPRFGVRTTGPDVFYRFTLVRREFVYIDTFASDPPADTVIGVATACGGVPRCVDNSCGTTRSLWSGALHPGTYYVLLETVTNARSRSPCDTFAPPKRASTPRRSVPLTATKVGATHNEGRRDAHT